MRTFQAERLAELEAERLKREREEEEANNPMKVSIDIVIGSDGLLHGQGRLWRGGRVGHGPPNFS